jgi:hypothetical protein
MREGPDMTPEMEDRIRVRAYDVWEREGRPADSELACWLTAEAEILEETIEAARALAVKAAADLPQMQSPSPKRGTA